MHGREPRPIAICPNRFRERGQVFVDCVELLKGHKQGNRLHVVSEVAIPGGSVDYFLVSVGPEGISDFVGIEFQTMDTTGTVWPERQRFLIERGLTVPEADTNLIGSFGMNWKMTAKTILVQIHHKLMTFEHLRKKLVLVLQDELLDYMKREFNFSSVHSPVVPADSMLFHPYEMVLALDGEYMIELREPMSTDSEGVAACLGLQAEARIELKEIEAKLTAKIDASNELPIGSQ